MLDVFTFQSPQSGDYQEFHYGSGGFATWIKPRGASMVRFLIIGAAAGGREGLNTTGGAGGGSGSVTSLIIPAMFIPDSLVIVLGQGGVSSGGGGSTTISYQSKTTYNLLSINGASGTGGPAVSPPPFAAAGIFRSINGQDGAASGSNLTASTQIFLTGGSGGANNLTLAGGEVASLTYGYPNISGGAGNTGGAGQNGYFITQPVIYGAGGGGGGGGGAGIGGAGGKGGIGCGGGGGGRGTPNSLGGKGGDAAVYIWAW
jgi:hypothetical protein